MLAGSRLCLHGLFISKKPAMLHSTGRGVEEVFHVCAYDHSVTPDAVCTVFRYDLLNLEPSWK